jgi:hypothetical protein
MSLQLPDVISPSYCIPCNLFYYMTQWIQHGRQGCVCTRLLYDPSSFSWLPQFFRSAKRRMNNCKPSTTRITGQPDRTTEGTRYILRCLKQPEKKSGCRVIARKLLPSPHLFNRKEHGRKWRRTIIRPECHLASLPRLHQHGTMRMFA